MPNIARPGRSRLFFTVLRVVFVTFLATLLAFCIGLFFGIVGIVLIKMIRGAATPDMAVAYRYIALPIAIAALAATFVIALVYEIREYKQTRARERLSAPRTRAA